MEEIHTLKNIIPYEQTIQNMTPEEMAERDREIERADAEAAARAKQERYEKSGAPRRYWRESLDTYKLTNDEQRKAAAAVAELINKVNAGKKHILVLLGGVGTGKTHLCCAAIREIGGQYMTAAEMVEEIRHAKAFDAEATEKQIIERYANNKLSVMDEVGRGINATDEKYMIYSYVNAIYNMNGSAIITSNFSKSDFIQYVGAAVTDRLVEYGSIIEIGGESYRKKLRRSNDERTK